MQRVFTEDVLRDDGTVRFPKGMVSSEYGANTWDAIAEGVGKPLGEFTKPVEEVALASVTPDHSVGGSGQPGPTAPAPGEPALAPARESPRRKRPKARRKRKRN